ncbi:MAG: hypothetical protein ACLSUM_14565 [Dysosmobacter welbionis]
MTIQEIAGIAFRIFLVLCYSAKVGGFIELTTPFLQDRKEPLEKPAEEFGQEQRGPSEQRVLILIARAFLGVSLLWFIFVVLFAS